MTNKPFKHQNFNLWSISWSYFGFRLFNYDIEIALHAKRKWNDVKLFKNDNCNHFVWWKLSILYGYPHMREITLCPHCYAPTVERGMDDEYLTFCSEECGILEALGNEPLRITMEEYEQCYE